MASRCGGSSTTRRRVSITSVHLAACLLNEIVAKGYDTALAAPVLDSIFKEEAISGFGLRGGAFELRFLLAVRKRIGEYPYRA